MRTRVGGMKIGCYLVAAMAAACGGESDEQLATDRSAITGALPAGTSISVAIATPANAAVVPPGALTVTGQAQVADGIILADTDIVYVIDVSGSTGANASCGGAFNADGQPNTILDCELASVLQLDLLAGGQANVHEIGMVVFGADAHVADLDPATGVQLRRPAGDLENETVLRSVNFGQVARFTSFNVGSGATDYAAAIEAAASALSGSTMPRKLVVFLSDGLSNEGAFEQELTDAQAAVPGVRFFTFAVGPTAACGANVSGGTGTLERLARATGGTCTNVTTPANLPAVLPGVIGSQLASVKLFFGAPDPAATTTSPALPAAGPVTTSFSGVVELLTSGLHTICARASGSDAGGPDSIEDCITVTVNSPPAVTCADQTVLADASCKGAASVLTGSSDPDGQALTCSQTPTGPFALGSSGASATCSDPLGASATCSANVTVVDVTAPTLVCPVVAPLECQSGGRAATFSVTASDNCSAPVAQCDHSSGETFPLGHTTVSCGAADASGNPAACSFDVTVQDTTAPVITTASAPIVLWPPNHKYRDVTLADCVTAVTDACGGVLDPMTTGQIVRITSDEGESANGSGNTCDDALIIGGTTARLRAERTGNGNGRVYTVVFAVTDAAGNASQATCAVQVPHNQGPNGGAVNSGCAYCTGTGCGTCAGPAPSCN